MQNFQNLSLENSTFKRDHLAGGLPLKLHAIYPAKSPERELPKGASEINDQADKMNRISREMKNLVEGSSSSKE
jgi:hypothetical protein